MTSRAGPTILERILDGREPLLDLMNEYRAAIEQEVRDDIRARVEATGIARMLREPLPWDGHQQKLARKAMQEVAAISSSSATETQDGERPAFSITTEGTPEEHARARQMAREHGRFATPTPDDRDREVERMARLGEAALADDPPWAEAMLAKIDAGLRASGGD